MELKLRIKMMLLKKNMRQIELAKKYGMSKNTFNNFLQRDNFKIAEIEKIADILGYDVDVKFVDRDNGETL